MVQTQVQLLHKNPCQINKHMINCKCKIPITFANFHSDTSHQTQTKNITLDFAPAFLLKIRPIPMIKAILRETHLIMHHEIYRIAYQLNAEGKDPSVALIRSRLSIPTSLPVIVQALQQWKLTPELGKDDNIQTTLVETVSEMPCVTSNAKAIALMENRIEALENQVAQLMEMIKLKTN